MIASLKECRKIASATHNMCAYRIRGSAGGSFVQDCDDDGETHAGGRMLHLLEVSGVSLLEVSGVSGRAVRLWALGLASGLCDCGRAG